MGSETTDRTEEALSCPERNTSPHMQNVHVKSQHGLISLMKLMLFPSSAIAAPHLPHQAFLHHNQKHFHFAFVQVLSALGISSGSSSSLSPGVMCLSNRPDYKWGRCPPSFAAANYINQTRTAATKVCGTSACSPGRPWIYMRGRPG